MMCKVIKKYWNVLQINPDLPETFRNNPVVALKRNKNLQGLKTYNYRRSCNQIQRREKNRKDKKKM